MTATITKHPGLNLGPLQEDPSQQTEETVFGFWVFLMSDAIIFGVIFATYASMVNGTAGGPKPEDLFDIKSAFMETMLLLTSSFTFGRASLALKYSENCRPLLAWLSLTLLLGFTFLGLEINDFLTMFSKGGYPQRSGFLSAFFGLVPLHGLHVTAGSIWMMALMAHVAFRGADRDAKLGLLRLGLFWHFLDIVWVAIFSVVYLSGLA